MTRTPGYNDHFSATYFDEEKGDYHTISCGYGAEGAAKAVDVFESSGGLGLRRIKLDPNYGPLGLRVYTEPEDS